jgi:fatty acid desaturase
VCKRLIDCEGAIVNIHEVNSNRNGQESGEEFRDDLRPLHAPTSSLAVGSGNAQARRVLSAAELAPLTKLNNFRSALAVLQTLAIIAAAMGVALWLGPSAWVIACVMVIGVAQHGLFILAHESAHYRLFSHRGVNDVIGRVVGMAGGVSMCTYRVTHRLHHNHLYTSEDPDTAIHGGYPRGVKYLWKKLAQDLIGLNAYKTYAYFFGAPALNAVTNKAARPLDDTSPQLRATARADRWYVVAFHLTAPLLCALMWGWQGLAWYVVLWALPLLTVLQPILRLRAICEHGATTDFSSPLTAARTNRTWGNAGNWLGRALLFPHHVNYHLEHHLYPAVPHYHLPQLHRLLLGKGALQGAEVRDVAETFRLIFAPRVRQAAQVNSPLSKASP